MLSTVSQRGAVVSHSQRGDSQSRSVHSQRRVAVLSRRLNQDQYLSMGQCFSVGSENKGRKGLRTTARAAARANGEPMKVMIAGAPGTYSLNSPVVLFFLEIPSLLSLIEMSWRCLGDVVAMFPTVTGEETLPSRSQFSWPGGRDQRRSRWRRHRHTRSF